jgi:hypothetical protein
MVDRSPHWAEAIPLRSTSAASCADTLVGSWVARFGVQEQITSDRGRQFCSSVWDVLTRQLGVKMRFMTPYHPQSNGVARFHRRLKDALRARMAGADWSQHLPWVLLGLRAGFRHLGGRTSLWLLSFFTWSIFICRRAATQLIRQPVAVITPLSGGPLGLFPAPGSAASGAAIGILRLCAVTSSITRLVARLLRSLPC